MRRMANMKRTASVGAGVLAMEIAATLTGAPVGALATTGYLYQITTGPYYPGYYADDCLKANVANDDSNQAYSYSSLTGGRCGGTGAPMAGGWIAVDAQGYKDGAYCGETGWAYNGSTVSTFGVGARECEGSGTYATVAYAEWWTETYGSYGYYGPFGITSPNQNV